MTNQGVNFQLPSGGQFSAAVDTMDIYPFSFGREPTADHDKNAHACLCARHRKAISLEAPRAWFIGQSETRAAMPAYRSAWERPLRAPSTQNLGVSLLVVDLTETIRHVELRLSLAVLTPR
jgi:hypothetical protein